MLVRCQGTEAQRQAVKSLMMIRMRMAGFLDHTYWWQCSKPGSGKKKLDPDGVLQWIKKFWGHASKIKPEVLVDPADAERWDREDCNFDLFLVPEWPTDKIIGKRVRDDGTYSSDERWIRRLIDSIEKHGIIDPLLAWNHVPSQRVVGQPPGTPNVVLGNNRIAVAQNLGIPHIPVVVSYQKGKKPPYEHRQITFEELHDDILNHRGDLWVTPDDWMLVHPPTRFHDEADNREHEVVHP